jgi:nucleotide-binding universal stress UspA family protein
MSDALLPGMTRTIICATDFSPAAERAGQLAAQLGRLFGDRLQLVHRVPRSPFIHPELVGATLGPVAEAARAAMRAQRERLAPTGVEIYEEVAIGPIEDRLLALAAEPSTRLLAMGTRGRNCVARAIAGSVAERVARQAACPVLVVPGALARARTWTPPRPLRLTVAVDRSPATDAALEWVKELAALAPSQKELVHS